MSEVRVHSSYGGCLGVIAMVLFVWALLFGVTYEGKHYGISCSRDRGVEVEK